MGERTSELNSLDIFINNIKNVNEYINQDIDEIYYQLLENAIEYGMTPKQFWEDDIEEYYCYQYAYLKKLHNTCHTQGLYNYVALSIALGNAFREKNKKPLEYPQENILATRLKEIEQEQKQNAIYKAQNITKQNLEEQYRLRLANCY